MLGVLRHSSKKSSFSTKDERWVRRSFNFWRYPQHLRRRQTKRKSSENPRIGSSQRNISHRVLAAETWGFTHQQIQRDSFEEMQNSTNWGSNHYSKIDPQDTILKCHKLLQRQRNPRLQVWGWRGQKLKLAAEQNKLRSLFLRAISEIEEAISSGHLIYKN